MEINKSCWVLDKGLNQHVNRTSQVTLTNDEVGEMNHSQLEGLQSSDSSLANP